MQINYDNNQARFATSTFWYAPDLWNALQDVMGPQVYAPYGTQRFWPPSTVREQLAPQVTNRPDQSIAPNSAKETTVARAAAVSGIDDGPPASTPSMAAQTGQILGPSSLVAPMPTITPRPSDQVGPTPVVVCDPISSWVNQNKGIAALLAVGVFFALGGHK